MTFAIDSTSADRLRQVMGSFNVMGEEGNIYGGGIQQEYGNCDCYMLNRDEIGDQGSCL